MTSSPLVSFLLFWPLFVFGLLLPGFLLGRIVRTPAPWLSAFLGSAVVLFFLVLALDASHIPLGPRSVGLGLAVINGALLLASRLLRRQPTALNQPRKSILPRGVGWLWVIPPAFAIAAIAGRAIADPLSGFDHVFRWDFLARQMLRTGTLAFYPPMTAEDFHLYAWCDGIPPLVSVLNFWSYASAGRLDPFVTAPRVILEAVLIFSAVWQLARSRWGVTAGWPAAAALATSPLLLWGVAMGQETGLTALSLVAMLVFLDEHERTGERSSLFWAGVAAGVGALSREYGLAWPLLGLGALAWHGRLRAGGGIFALTAAAISAPWYLRNWSHTGNPLYAHRLGGLFPTNPAHDEGMEIIAQNFSILQHPELLTFGLGFFAAGAGVLIVLAAWGARSADRRHAPIFGGIVVVAALCVWSVAQTSAGWGYAMRVLTPALALTAVLAAAPLARLAASRARVVAIGLGLLALDAAGRSFFLPQDHRATSPELLGGRWREMGESINAAYRHRLWGILATEAGDRGIIVDHPALHAVFTALNATVIPLVSPQVAFLYDEKLSFPAALAQLRRERVRFILLSHENQIVADLVQRHRFFRSLRTEHKPVSTLINAEIYDLDLLAREIAPDRATP